MRLRDHYYFFFEENKENLLVFSNNKFYDELGFSNEEPKTIFGCWL